MTETHIADRLEGATRIFTIVNPARRNALKPAMREDLAKRIAEASDDSQVRAIIIHGEGEHFCAGADISNLDQGTPSSPAQLAARIGQAQNLVRSIALGAKPVIAAVEGSAFGAGFSLACVCDLIVAAEGATFGASFTSLGITAEFGLFSTLPRRVGHQVARRMIYLAEKIGGKRAFDMGLADRLAPTGGAMATALEIAAGFAALPPLAITATKRAFAGVTDSFEETLRLELEIMPPLALSADFREAVTAFREKRPAKFTGS